MLLIHRLCTNCGQTYYIEMTPFTLGGRIPAGWANPAHFSWDAPGASRLFLRFQGAEKGRQGGEPGQAGKPGQPRQPGQAVPHPSNGCREPAQGAGGPAQQLEEAPPPRRSEERRVGKECRSRWSPDLGKKNKEQK